MDVEFCFLCDKIRVERVEQSSDQLEIYGNIRRQKNSCQEEPNRARPRYLKIASLQRWCMVVGDAEIHKRLPFIEWKRKSEKKDSVIVISASNLVFHQTCHCMYSCPKILLSGRSPGQAGQPKFPNECGKNADSLHTFVCFRLPKQTVLRANLPCF